jgi:hypothetical protein
MWARGMFLDTIDATLAMSVLTYAEVMVHPTIAGKVAEFEQNIAGLGIEIVAVGTEDAPALAHLRDNRSGACRRGCAPGTHRLGASARLGRRGVGE